MQGRKTVTAVEFAKEAAANVGASALAGKEKSKAVAQEKLAKARAHDPAEKAAADARAQERVREVEAAKQDAMRRNAAAKERATATAHQPTLPQPPAPAVDARDAALPGTRLVNDSDNAEPVSSGTGAGVVTDAAPNATETGAAATCGHVAGAPEAAVVNDDAPPVETSGRHP